MNITPEELERRLTRIENDHRMYVAEAKKDRHDLRDDVMHNYAEQQNQNMDVWKQFGRDARERVILLVGLVIVFVLNAAQFTLWFFN